MSGTCSMHLLASAIDAAPIQPASPGIMLLFAAVMMATYVGVAIERFHKTVAALCGAVVLVALSLALGLFEYPKIYDILEEDLNIFGVIIGTGILVDVIGKSGLFHFLGMWIVRLTGGRASTLFLTLCLVTFLFVAVLTIPLRLRSRAPLRGSLLAWTSPYYGQAARRRRRARRGGVLNPPCPVVASLLVY